MTTADKLVSRPPRSALALGIVAGVAIAATAVVAWVILAARGEPAAPPANTPPDSAASATSAIPAARGPASADEAGAPNRAASGDAATAEETVAAAAAGSEAAPGADASTSTLGPTDAETERPRLRATPSRRRAGTASKSGPDGRADSAPLDPIAGELKDPFAAPSK